MSHQRPDLGVAIQVCAGGANEKDYMNLPATVAFPLSASSAFTASGDYDGDGRQELLVADFVAGVATLATVSLP